MPSKMRATGFELIEVGRSNSKDASQEAVKPHNPDMGCPSKDAEPSNPPRSFKAEDSRILLTVVQKETSVSRKVVRSVSEGEVGVTQGKTVDDGYSDITVLKRLTREIRDEKTGSKVQK